MNSASPRLNLVRTGHVELGLAVVGKKPPVLLVLDLAVVAHGVGLPGLIKGLKVEDVNAPGEHGTDRVLVVFLSVLRAGLGSFIVGTTVCRC